MKFYNPFKPHIVEFEDGKFAVRKRGCLGCNWVYKDSEGWMGGLFKDIIWWSAEYLKHAKVNTYSEAFNVIKLEKKNPNIVVRVYHG